MKTKMKGKAIIGISMAAIMVVSVLAATMPMVGAESRTDNFNYILKQTAAQKVLIGQNLQFEGFDGTVTISRLVSGDIENVYQADADDRIYNVNWPTSGAYYVNYVTGIPATYDAQLSVEDPDMPLKLKVGTKEVSSIALKTKLTIDTGGMNLFPEDQVDLVIKGPDWQIKYDDINKQQFTDITVAQLNSWYGDNNLKTTGWTIGAYTFKVKTDDAQACGLEAESVVKPLLILKGGVAIEADTTTTVDAGEPLVVTGTSNWQEGYAIVVTCTGPVELSPQVVKIVNGAFEATFDTTGAVTGEYIVKADDGDGHVDEVEVFIRGVEVEVIEEVVKEAVEEVVEEISPTPAPTPSEAIEEVVEEVVEEISATPAPTPSEAIEEVVEEVVEEISATPAPTPSEAIEEVVEEVVEKEVEKEVEETLATPTPSYQELIDKALEELPMGRILFNPPKEMKVRETKLVEVRITQNRTEDLTKGLEGPGEPQIKETEVSTYMKVRLTGSGFAIDPEISEAQMIESDKYTHWEFHVTPLKSGIQTLRLTYFVIISVQGTDRQKEYEVGDWEVSVKVTPMGLLKCYWQFIVGTLIAIVTLIISIISIRKKKRREER